MSRAARTWRRIAVGLLVVGAVARAQSPAPATRPALEHVERAVERGAAYLVRACREDGQFVYRIHLDPDLTPRPAYNLLRHAGAVYALAMRHQWRAEDACRRAVLRAARWMKDHAVAPLEGRPDLLALWSDPAITHDPHDPREAKLGGAGLALTALVCIERFAPGQSPLEDLRRLGEFIRYMQKPDGSFYAKFIPAAGGRDDRWTSLYYPGEAALGLMMLYEIDPQERWLQAAADAIGYLARRREDDEDPSADHWALLATARLLPHYARCPSPPVPREQIVRHAAQICEGMLDGQVTDPRADWLRGCFTYNGCTSPTATRVEGLTAALTVLPEQAYGQLRGRIEAALELAVAFLIAAQVDEGRHAGAVPWAARRWPDRYGPQAVRFNERVGEVRIDYVQHAVSGWLGYLAVQEVNSTSRPSAAER